MSNLLTAIGFFTVAAIALYLCRVVWLQADRIERLERRVAEMESQRPGWTVTPIGPR